MNTIIALTTESRRCVSVIGHTRPMCNLVPHVVKAHRVHLTILVVDTFFDRVSVEIARNFDQTEQELYKLVRLASFVPVQDCAVSGACLTSLVSCLTGS